MQEQMGETYGAAGRNTNGGSTVEDFKETTRDVIDETKGAAANLAGKAREQVKAKVSTQKEKAVIGLEDVTQTLHDTGNQLQDQGKETMGNLLDSAATQIDNLTDYLRGRNVEDLFRDIEEVARRKPTVFIGGAFILGLAAARFLKSSSPASGGYRSWEHASMQTPSQSFAGTSSYTATPDLSASRSGMGAAASSDMTGREAANAWSSEQDTTNVTDADLDVDELDEDATLGAGRSEAF